MSIKELICTIIIVVLGFLCWRLFDSGNYMLSGLALLCTGLVAISDSMKNEK